MQDQLAQREICSRAELIVVSYDEEEATAAGLNHALSNGKTVSN